MSSKATIEAIFGDITQAEAEAIVNAANSQLWMGAGVGGFPVDRNAQRLSQRAIASAFRPWPGLAPLSVGRPASILGRVGRMLRAVACT